MDPRLTYKIGRQEFVKSPCVKEKCVGCPKQFEPVPFEGELYCKTYISPEAKWSNGKTCPFMYVLKPEKEQKMNPIKASKRGVKFSVVASVSAATGSKESGKKKTERRDSR